MGWIMRKYCGDLSVLWSLQRNMNEKPAWKREQKSVHNNDDKDTNNSDNNNKTKDNNNDNSSNDSNSNNDSNSSNNN